MGQSGQTDNGQTDNSQTDNSNSGLTDQTNTGTATQTPPVNTTPPANNNTGTDGFTRDESGAIVTDGSCPWGEVEQVEEKHGNSSINWQW